MRRVDLFKNEDIEKLRGLKGSETLFIKVHSSFRPTLVDAVDLSKYKGVIQISSDLTTFLPMRVRTSSKVGNVWFFTNAMNAQILIPRLDFNVEYQYVPISVSKTYNIGCEADLLALQNSFFKCQKLDLILTRDIVLSKKITDYFDGFKGSISLRGKGHRVYMTDSSDWERFQKQENVQVGDVLPTFVDQIILLKKPNDLRDLHSITSGVVVISLEKDLHGAVMSSVYLGHFKGTLLFLGNGHSLEHLTIYNKYRNHGFFSMIHPASDLKVFDLNMNYVSNMNSSYATQAGLFLGRRCPVTNNVKNHFMPGSIYFENCHVSNVSFPFLSQVSGAFVGIGDDGMDFNHCSFTNCTDFYQRELTSIVGKMGSGYLDFSFDTSSVCYDGPKLLRKKQEL